MKTLPNILVVDDSATQVLELQEILEAGQCRVTTAGDAAQALVRLEDPEVPDVIISDVVMPGQSGYDLCRKVKADPRLREIPFILLTSLADRMDIIRGINAGADSYLVKPCDRGLLMARVQYVLTNRRLRREGMPPSSVRISLGGQEHQLNTDRIQLLDMLLATYDEALKEKEELEKTNRELRQALAQVQTLEGLIPICAWCKKVRDDQGYWQQVEVYVHRHSRADFSHGICPDCLAKQRAEIAASRGEEGNNSPT